MDLAIVVNLDIRGPVALNPRATMRQAELRIGDRPAASIGMAQLCVVKTSRATGEAKLGARWPSMRESPRISS
jgi:hypothetical protein